MKSIHRGLISIIITIVGPSVWAVDYLHCLASAKHQGASYRKATELYNGRLPLTESTDATLTTHHGEVQFILLVENGVSWFQIFDHSTRKLLMNEKIDGFPATRHVEKPSGVAFTIECVPYSAVDYCRYNTCL